MKCTPFIITDICSIVTGYNSLNSLTSLTHWARFIKPSLLYMCPFGFESLTLTDTK